MKTLKLAQGSPEWLAHRRSHFNASDAAAMMGCSPYKTRNQLLHELKTGIAAEVSAEGQRRFDDGHRFEAMARPLAEEFIGEELYPVVGTEGKLSASFDGLTMLRNKNFEHKSLNDELRAIFADIETMAPEYRDTEGGKLLPLYHRVQMEHQHLVCKTAEKTLFMASKWRGEDLVEEKHCWYTPDPELAAQVAAGWDQFEKDLDAYEPVELATPIVATPVVHLPALSIKVEGSISLIDNLTVFGEALQAYVAGINLKPETDQDFANLDTVIKTLKRAEDELEAGEKHALSQTESISVLRTTVAQYKELARTNRLLANRLFTTEKANRKQALVTNGGTDFATFMAELNATFPKPYMPAVETDFAGVVSGLKSLDSMKNAIDSELARAKIAANEIANLIRRNINTLVELASDYKALFPDTAQIVLKANDDLTALVKTRISEHLQAEQTRLENERERIRKEERDRMDDSQIMGIQQQVIIASMGRAGVRQGGTIECIRETLAETEAWLINADQFAEYNVARAQAAKDDAVRRIGLLLAEAEAKAAPRPAAQPAAVIEQAAQAAAPTPAGNVTPMRAAAARAPTPAPATPPSLKLGDINALLSPITLTADGLATLGFAAVTVKSAKLYHDHDLTNICAALHAVLDRVQTKQAA